MKSLITFILSTFWIFSYSQEKVFTEEYRNRTSTRYCVYTKHDMKPFNGYVKINAPVTGTIQYEKIENGCNVTVFEEFNSKNELLYRGRYSYKKKTMKSHLINMILLILVRVSFLIKKLQTQQHL